ncbi:HPP family protein [Gordonia sp. VNQ95]|uniref:HPP family protein n=1 Tax=Gordonia sp. VNQ95 TaxID=3156619 RepID=UPI0032B52D21
MNRVLRGLGPAGTAGSVREALRAGVGAVLGLTVVGAVLVTSGVSPTLGFFLIAPFGATTVLVFAAPNSPLAQPWPTVVGSSLSALVGVAITLLIDPVVPRVALAVGLAIAVMIVCRAVHPPAGAVAMSAALAPDTIHQIGYEFALAPVALGCGLLVVVAAVYGRLTGRPYPFRQFDPVHESDERVGLDEGDLTEILERYQQSLNLSVADLARLVGAAEQRAAGHLAEPVHAADVMSRDLVTVAPESPHSELAELFRTHRFTSLPVVRADGTFAGVVFQIDLIESVGLDPRRTGSSLRPRRRGGLVTAADVMTTHLPVVTADTPIAALLPQLSDHGADAVPVVDGDEIVGIVTQTDLISVLARQAIGNG